MSKSHSKGEKPNPDNAVLLKPSSRADNNSTITAWIQYMSQMLGRTPYHHFAAIFEKGAHHVFNKPAMHPDLIRLTNQHTAWLERDQAVADEEGTQGRATRSGASRTAATAGQSATSSTSSAATPAVPTANSSTGSAAPPAVPPIVVPPVALTATQVVEKESYTRAYRKRVENYERYQEDYDNQYFPVWVIIMDSLEPDFKSLVRSKPAYTLEYNGARNPLNLFELIRICYHSMDSGKSDGEVKMDLYELYMQTKQGHNENVQEYLDRFTRDVILYQGRLVNVGTEEDQSLRFFRGLDDKRHGRFKSYVHNMKLTPGTAADIPKTPLAICELAVRYADGQETYPVDATETAYVATASRLQDAQSSQPKHDARSSGRRDTRSRPLPQRFPCALCDQLTHRAHECPFLSAAKRSVQGDSQVLHAANLAIYHLDDMADNVVDSNSVIYDTGATMSLFGNPNLLENLRSAPPVIFQGVNGSVRANQVGDFMFVKDVYYSPDAIANLLSCSQAGRAGIRRGRNDAMNAYFIERDGECVYFHPEKNLYVNRPPERCLLTVAEMESRYSKEDIAKAKFARLLSQRMGVPCDKDAYSLAVHNSAGGYNGVTPKHFIIAEQIWGKRIAALAGKSTEPNNIKIKLEPVFSFAKPALDVFIDIFFVAKIPFLVSVVKPIGLILTNCLASRSANCISSVVLQQLLVLHKHQYAIRTLTADGEHGIHKGMDTIAKAGIRVVEVVSTHVPQAECAIKTVKSWARGILVELPFRLPTFLIDDLISFVVQRLNMLSSKRGFNGLSAIEALTGQRVDLNTEVRAAFGDYCHVTTPNLGLNKSNVLVPRTEPAIALANKGRGGAVKFYSLTTGKRVTRTKFTILPTPQDVIAKMNKVAEERAISPDDLISAEDADNDAQLNELHVHEEEVRNDFQFLEHDPQYADLLEHADGPGERYADTRPHTHELEPGARARTVNEEPVCADVPEVASSTATDGSELEEVFNPEPRPYNTRGKVRDYRNIQRAFNITVKKALNDNPDAARKAIAEELLQLKKKDCFGPVHAMQLDPYRKRKLLRSFMFLKEKNKPDGTFDKLKARLVANGSQQESTAEQKIANSSPTASLTSILMVASIAAKEKRHVVTVDVKSAYINARMPDDEIVDIIIEPSIATELVKLAPEFATTLRYDGSLVVNLRGALYGTQQAAKLWYLDISKYLKELGFITNEKDSCVFNLHTDMGQLTVALYVDDLKLTCADVQTINWLLAKLEDKYEEITVHRGRTHHYLGMTFDYTKGLTVSMAKYEADLVEDITRTVSTPALDDLYSIDSDSPALDELDRKKFHTLVAKLMFMAKRSRPDVLLPTAFLATRVLFATVQDNEKLQRVLSYLKGNRDFQLSIDPTILETVVAYTDASHATQERRVSQSGAVIFVHGFPVYVASRKQHCVSLSSYEAELMALSEEGKEVVWCQSFLRSQTNQDVPVTLYCDNLGLVQSLQFPKSQCESNAKHIETRYFWMQENVAQRSIAVKFIRTEEQVADFFTKPLQGTTFKKLRDCILRKVESL
jgi:hypothetical protein